MQDLQALVDAADEAALLRAVDGLCASRDWDALVDLARRCRDAVEFGRQLWGVAMHVDYRLALEAPAPYAARVLRAGAGRFALGPLTEVAAGQHEWAALAPYVPEQASAAAVAQERVLRGEDLRGKVDAPVDLPLYLAPFEPRYALPTYRDRSAAFPEPEVATRRAPPAEPVTAGELLPDDDAVAALRAVTEPWVAESSGRSAAITVAGDAPAAVGCFSGEASMLEIPASDALALLQWAGASGGAHGRRRGGAAGRFSAWWAASALAGLPWPDEFDEALVHDVGEAVSELRWYRWRPASRESGWVLRLAVADPADGLAWAVQAVDEDSDEV
jgi:hypothetical protein